MAAVLLGIALIAGCSGFHVDDDDDFGRLDYIVEESWRGRNTTAELISSLGPPHHQDVERIANRYDQRQTDEIWTLSYPGLEARIYKVHSNPPKDLLIGLWVADPRYEVGPYFQIGTRLERIEDLFDEACDSLSPEEWLLATKAPNAECDATVCALRCGPGDSSVLFKFTQGRIDRIDWDYDWD